MMDIPFTFWHKNKSGILTFHKICGKLKEHDDCDTQIYPLIKVIQR